MLALFSHGTYRMAKSFDPARIRPPVKSLTRPVLVGGSLQSPWLFVPFSVAAALFGGGVIALFQDAIPVFVGLAIFAGLAALPGFAALALILSRRRWLEVTLDGFALTRRDRRQLYSDEQVAGLSQRTRSNHDGSYWRFISLDIDSPAGADRLNCSYLVEQNQADPLYAFVDRVVLGMARRIGDNLEQGAVAEGQGWRFDKHGLHLHHGPRRGSYAADELTYMGFYDKSLCVWRGMEDTPLARIPDSTRNVHCLAQLIWKPIHDRPGVNDPPPGSRLGRLLLIRRGGDAILGWCVIALVLLLGLLFFPMVSNQAPLVVMSAYGVFLWLVALMGAWLVWRASYMRLHFHQAGIAQPGRGRAICYAELERMTWSPHLILLEPRPDIPAAPIRFSTIGFQEDADLANMRLQMAQAIAQRWWEQLGQGPVRWTANLQFLPEGLEYSTTGMFGRSEPTTAPYQATSYYLLATGMELFVVGHPQAVLSQPQGVKNFYPGLALLDWIYASIREQAERNQRSASEPLDIGKAWQARKAAKGSEERIRGGEVPGGQVKPGDEG